MTSAQQYIECDILVVGGGLGGTAAAVRAARMGYRVCLTEETYWIGGQCTSQGMAALAEPPTIESFGGTAAYCEFRDRVRTIYLDNYSLSTAAQSTPYLNPGAGWASRLCFEPRVGLAALLYMVVPEIEAGRLEIFYGARVQEAEIQNETVRSVSVAQPDYDRLLHFSCTYVLDATELGDLLPLLDIPYVVEDETDEAHAGPDGPAPELVHPFTFPFALDFRPGEDHTIAKPANYENNRDNQPYATTVNCNGNEQDFNFFEVANGSPGAFWTHHRIFAAENFVDAAHDLIVVNWPGNACKTDNIIDTPAAQRTDALQRAKDLSLGLLYWLQTEVRRDDGNGRGYPELRLRGDILGTDDGLSQHPYIRTSRRIKARKTVREQDISAADQTGARAAFFADSIGLGYGPDAMFNVLGDGARTIPTRPFQIPLGAFIPQGVTNLLPACKNIGTTHITQSYYHPHSTEWNIGEAAGALAAFCLGQHQTPTAVYDKADLRRQFQVQLLELGVPLYWYEDMPSGHPAASACQLLAQTAIWPGASDHLLFNPDKTVEAREMVRLLEIAGLPPDVLGAEKKSRAELARCIADLKFALS